ncbi:MAG: ATP-binding cassette domain-containing protein, partial [Lachnospiraceae bacterium]|nr:ATP-binding cassette domain-containing protein [Lachnospiraceae bacterium]
MLKVQDLSIEFHDQKVPKTVVFDFDLQIEEGEIVGLVGESGSGKTVSALSIAGLLSRKNLGKKGSISFEGVDILNCSRKELRSLQGDDIAMVFQEPMTSLDPLKKIGYQVEESLVIHKKLPREERREKVISALKEVELNNVELIMEQYPHELSGGMRQRVM